MTRHLSPCQVEAALNSLLAAYPEVVSRWAVGLVAEPPAELAAWLRGGR